MVAVALPPIVVKAEMMQSYVFLSAWAMAAGAAIPLMAILNAGLGRNLCGAPVATATVFVVGLLTALLLNVVMRPRLPSIESVEVVPRYLFLGGVIAAFYVFSVTSLAPRFGVANTVMFVMVAQILSSSAIDAFGLFGAGMRPIGMQRAMGLVILVLGLIIAQFGSGHPPAGGSSH